MASSNLWQFLRLSLGMKALTVLKRTKQVFHRMPLILGLLSVFLMVSLGFGGKTTEVKGHSHHIPSKTHTINMIHQDINLDHLAEVCLPGFFSVVTPLPSFPHCSFWKHVVQHSLAPFLPLLLGSHFQLCVWKRNSLVKASVRASSERTLCPAATPQGLMGLCLLSGSSSWLQPFGPGHQGFIILNSTPALVEGEASLSLGTIISSQNQVKKWGSTWSLARKKLRIYSR